MTTERFTNVGRRAVWASLAAVGIGVGVSSARPIEPPAESVGASDTAQTTMATGEATGPTLRLGDPAPPLSISEWVRGPGVDSLNPGPVWVVLCWATWTPVSREAARDLSQLQTQWHTSARVVGVAWADEQRGQTLEDVRAYVADRDSFMRFPIAFDASGQVAEGWLEAAGAEHVPWVFVIDQQGTLAWHGHPSDPDLAMVVDQVRAGQWDHEAYLADKALQAAAQAKTDEAFGAFHAGEHARCVGLLNEVFEMDRDRFAQHALWAFQVMVVEMDQGEAAKAYARDLADGPLADKPDLLANMAWIEILDPNPAGFDQAFAEDLAERALEASGRQHGHAWAAMAMVERRRGEYEASMEAWRRALLFVASDELEQFYLGLEAETSNEHHDSMGYGPPVPEGLEVPGE